MHILKACLTPGVKVATDGPRVCGGRGDIDGAGVVRCPHRPLYEATTRGQSMAPIVNDLTAFGLQI